MLFPRPARCTYVLNTFVIALSVIALATASAHAQTISSPPASPTSPDSLWSGDVDNDWNKAGNWETGGVPGSGGNVFIPRGNKVCVVTSAIIPSGSGYFNSLVVTGGYGTASDYPLRLVGAGEMTVLNTFVGTNGDGQMLIDEGGLLRGSALVIGGDINDSAADADSGFVNLYGTLEYQTAYVGVTGTGELTLQAGSDYNTQMTALGYEAGSSGTVNLLGVESSRPTYTGQFFVGRAGAGTLNITDAKLLNGSSSSSVYLGTQATGNGTLMVDNGVLDTMSLLIGQAGTGTAMIRNGSTLNAGFGVMLGDEPGSAGTLTLTGQTTTASANMYGVGNAGSGLLEIINGATLGETNEQTFVQMAAAGNSTGELLVEGRGSLVENAVILGGQGGATADIVIQNYAKLDGVRMMVGESGTTGTLSIDNATWASDTAGSVLAVGGADSQAAAIISNGSTVTLGGTSGSGDGAVSLANGSASDGQLHVRDAGTTLTTRVLQIGGSSTNSTAGLYVYDSASVTANEGLHVFHTTGSTPHTIRVSEGGTLTASGTIMFNSGGTATDLEILSGGEVYLHQQDNMAMMIQNTDITIDGRNSLLRYDTGGATISTPLAFGAMPVTISNGGTLSAQELYMMQTQMTVTGNGSELRSSSSFIFDNNDATFTASDGALVTAESIFFTNLFDPKDTKTGLHVLTGTGTKVETGRLSVAAGNTAMSRLKIEAGASVIAVDGTIGSTVASGDALGEVLITGSGSEMIFANTLDVGQFVFEDINQNWDQPGRGHLRIKDGALVQADEVTLVRDSLGAGMGTINLNRGELRMRKLNDSRTDPGLNWMAGTLHFTGSTALSSASSWEDHLTLSAERTLVTDAELKINTGGSLTVAGGSADLTGLANFKATPIDLQYGSVRIHDGYLRWETLPLGSVFSNLTVDGSSGQLASLTFDNVAFDPSQKPFLDATIGATGNASWTVSNGTAFELANSLTVGPGGTVIVDAATLSAPNLIGSGDIQLTDPVAGPALTVGGGSYSGSISGTGSLLKNSSNKLTLSGSLSYTGETIIDGGTLEFQSDLTGTGGEIIVNAGGTLKAGDVTLQGHAISGTGRITLAGDATLGRGGVKDGFAFDGTLDVGSHTLTLMDNNRAFLGQTVNIDGGTIQAANGVRLNPVNSLNTSYVLNATGPSEIAAEFRNNGMVHGPTDGHFLVLSGDVSGAGSFSGKVGFTGSYSPGNSSAIVDVETILLSADNTLTMEIGGRVAGTDYDQLNVSGTALLGGTLELVMLNGYTLEPGEEYRLIDGSISGQFDSIVGLPAGWDLTYDAGSVTVTPEPATLGLLGLGGLAMLRRRRRR